MTYGGISHIKPCLDRFIEIFLLQTNSILLSYLFHINYFTHTKSYKIDKAKAAVSNFLSRDGKHETTVHETVNPAIENERVLRTEQENVQKVVDREVHQDHYHTSIQPIQHKEILPESHAHNIVGVEEREFRHGNDEHVRERLENERAQFKSIREVGDVQHTTAEAPTVAGEHIHHRMTPNLKPVS